MATNNNKRNAIRMIRDGVKSNYKKDTECRICGCDMELEFHHYHTVALLVKNFAKENHLDFNKEDVVLEYREAFIKQYWQELVEQTVTLCRDHHLALHKVYTKEPPLFTVKKQEQWVEKQRDKFLNKSSRAEQLPTTNSSSSLLNFITTTRKSLEEFKV